MRNRIHLPNKCHAGFMATTMTNNNSSEYQPKRDDASCGIICLNQRTRLDPPPFFPGGVHSQV